MSDTIYHLHHIVPRHMGGSDDPTNLVKLTVEEHAEAHRKLYEEYGRLEDKLAWKMLEGQAMLGENLRIKSILGGRKGGSKRKGKTLTEEHKSNISKVLSGRKRPEITGDKHPRRSKVCAGGIIFNSITEAYIYHGTNKNTVRNRCNNENFPDWYYIERRV